MRVQLSLVLVLTVAAAGIASAFTLFGRVSVVSSGAVMVGGQFSDQYTASFVTDGKSGACFMVLMDTKTRFFTTTPVDVASCTP